MQLRVYCSSTVDGDGLKREDEEELRAAEEERKSRLAGRPKGNKQALIQVTRTHGQA